MINIVRKGISPIPDEARKCPVCGEYAQQYSLENKYESYNLRCQQVVIDKYYYVQKYPTFTCKNCQTIWQYLGETPEKKEENE